MGRKVGQVGVPVVRRDAPGPFRAGLLFRAGLRYASFRTLPVPHLVEHLIMSELPRVPLAHNARVDDEVMVFHASGERSAVLDLIQQVARTVADPPLHRLAHEAKVVGLEEGLAVAPPMAGALLTRYGIHGVGLAGACGPAADQVTEAQVMEFTRRCLTRENAVLLVTGELPDGWSIELPEGPRPHMPVPVASHIEAPSLLRTACEGATLSYELTAEDAASGVLLLAVLQTALEEDLRHRRAMVYDVYAARRRVSTETTLSVVACTGRTEDLPAMAQAMVDELRRLADHGPTPEQLEYEVRSFAAWLDDPGDPLEALEDEAVRLLETGREPRGGDELLALMSSVGIERVQARAREALGRLLVEVSDEVSLEIAGLRDCTDDVWPEAPRHAGRRFRRRVLTLAPLDTAVTVGDEGLTLQVDGYASSMRWSEVAGVERDGDTRMVRGADGRVVPVIADVFRGSAELLRLIDRTAGDLGYAAAAE